MRTTPYGRTPSSRSLLAMRQPLRTCSRNCLRSASLPIAEPPPVGGQTGRDDRADHQVPRADLVGQPLQVVIGRIDVDVRIEEEQIDAVEFHAVDLRGGRQVEHGVEIDGRLGIGTLADQAGPRGVVQFGKLCAMP